VSPAASISVASFASTSLAASSGTTSARVPLPGRPTVIRLPRNWSSLVISASPRWKIHSGS